MTQQIYQQYVAAEVPRLLSYLDRELFSPCYGCFDRLHWAWGATDIANADLQKFSLPLTYIYQLEAPDNPFYHRPELLTWIEAAIQFCCSEQSRRGAFNQWLPKDNSIVSAGFVMHDLVLVAQLLENELQEETLDLLKNTARQAGKMLTRFEERHGFNSNHCLANAVALLQISAWLSDKKSAQFKARGMAIIREVVQRQSKSGAFYEYAGADPGYHTLGLAFLAACYESNPEPFILKAIKAAVEFSSHFISPISGNGGGYGTRGTHLLYPSGFEIAARQGIHPELPSRVLNIISDGLCVTPQNTDLTNLIPILSDYTRVCLMSENVATPSQLAPMPLDDFFCNETTLFAFPRGEAKIHGRLNGGMLTINSRKHKKILLASAGYMVECGKTKGFSGAFKGVWTRQGDTLTFKTQFQQTNRMRLTPMKLIFLRAYFSLCGNIMFLNLFIKKIMAWMLIFKQKFLNLQISRRIEIKDNRVNISDYIENNTSKTFKLRHCSHGYIHFMGSARYFDLSLLRCEQTRPVHESKNQELPRVASLEETRILKPGDKINISFAVELDS